MNKKIFTKNDSTKNNSAYIKSNYGKSYAPIAHISIILINRIQFIIHLAYNMSNNNLINNIVKTKCQHNKLLLVTSLIPFHWNIFRNECVVYTSNTQLILIGCNRIASLPLIPLQPILLAHVVYATAIKPQLHASPYHTN